MRKIRVGDEVIVITGKDKGKQGTVSSLLSNGKCYVSGVKVVKKHTKPNPCKIHINSFVILGTTYIFGYTGFARNDTYGC